MCQGDDNVNYDININVCRLKVDEKKIFRYQVEEAGKVYFFFKS